MTLLLALLVEQRKRWDRRRPTPRATGSGIFEVSVTLWLPALTTAPVRKPRLDLGWSAR